MHDCVVWQVVGNPWGGLIRWDSFNDSLPQLILDRVIILIQDSWLLLESAKQALKSVHTQLIIVGQRAMKLLPW